jgi:hypothetical protein
MRVRRAAGTVFSLCGLVTRLPAQIVRGTVVDQTGMAVPGVLVQLTDTTARVLGRTLTDDRGGFRILASAGGVFRVSTLRIGFRPTTSTSFTLGPGQERVERLTLSGVRVALDTMRVVSQSACRINADTASATFAAWEQARGALAATSLTGRGRSIEATVVGYQRTLEPDGRRIRQQQMSVRSAYVNEPWRSPTPEKLRETGYVVTERDGSVIYYAPSIDVLLSPSFVEDHCFRLTTDRRRRDMIGIAFEPVRERKTPEIQGTLWLDRTTSELRVAEFRYANIPGMQADFAGGDLALARFKTGDWAITSWQIRMPALENVVVRGHGSELRVANIEIAGGELALARRGRDTLWSRPPLTVTGVIRDSISGKALGGARIEIRGTTLHATSDERGKFEISGVLPGEYVLETSTASLDSIAAVQQTPLTVIDGAKAAEVRVASASLLAGRMCSGARPAPGIVVGTASVRADSAPAKNVRLVAEWIDASRSATGANEARVVQTRADSLGRFRFCDVPLNVAVTIRAESNPGAGTASTRIPEGSRVAKVSLSLATLPVPGAVFTGTVLADSSKQPIAGAEVLFPVLGRATLTDSRGAFRLEGLPAGDHQLTVRRIGYGPAETRIELRPDETTERSVFLARSATLDSVRVVATASERVRATFDEHRKLGLGTFYTKVDFEAKGITHIADLLQMTTGAAVLRGPGGGAWLVPHRTLSGRGQFLDEGDVKMGARKERCYSTVWVDGHRMYSGKDYEPLFNLNSFPIESIDAVEFYASGASTPVRYSEATSVCNGGTLVIWTRR